MSRTLTPLYNRQLETIFDGRPDCGRASKGLAQMSDYNSDFARQVPADRADMSVDVGLRSFMLGVYNKVALGLLLSAALAFLTSSFQPISSLLYTVSNGRVGYTVWGMVIAFAPLAVMMFGMFGMRNATPKTAGIFYWTIVSLIGASLGVVVGRVEADEAGALVRFLPVADHDSAALGRRGEHLVVGVHSDNVLEAGDRPVGAEFAIGTVVDRVLLAQAFEPGAPGVGGEVADVADVELVQRRGPGLLSGGGDQ